MPTTAIVIAVVVAAVLIGAFIFLRSRASLPASGPDLQRMIATMAEGAVTEARQQSVPLDYSADSIRFVEGLLGGFHERHKSGKMSDADVNQQAMLYGSYVGEVIRRLKGGEWARDHEQAGPHTYPLSYDEHQSFPIMWCGKRMVNGPEDNVWHKFQIIVLEEAPASSGGPAPE